MHFKCTATTVTNDKGLRASRYTKIRKNLSKYGCEYRATDTDGEVNLGYVPAWGSKFQKLPQQLVSVRLLFVSFHLLNLSALGRTSASLTSPYQD